MRKTHEGFVTDELSTELVKEVWTSHFKTETIFLSMDALYQLIYFVVNNLNTVGDRQLGQRSARSKP
jgi:hypothetical protein